MQQFEKDYANLVNKVLYYGEYREGRNGGTKAIFGETLKIKLNGSFAFPILQGRKMYPQGVLGEFAALVRCPTHVEDFEEFNCNYWKSWAKEDGSLNVDYGNSWYDFNGFNQVQRLKETLANNPTDRRMIITGWNPSNLDELDLPCCHMLYQFYVRKGRYLDIIWYQRSVDTMIGLPSDIILAATWLITLANEVGLLPGEITMFLGDTHIYEEHTDAAHTYVNRVATHQFDRIPTYRLGMEEGQAFETFKPGNLILSQFPSLGPLSLELKA